MARTKTYIAGDWDHDQDAVEQLYKWNESKKWSLSFSDAHELTQARDSSLNCSIKRSLAVRMNSSKTFVLIVGDDTNNVRAGGCQYCSSYNGWNYSCMRGNTVDYRSYIDYECEKAVNDGLNIIVLHKNTYKNKSKCPEAVRNIGYHTTMITKIGNNYYWDYQSVKAAFDYYG